PSAPTLDSTSHPLMFSLPSPPPPTPTLSPSTTLFRSPAELSAITATLEDAPATLAAELLAAIDEEPPLLARDGGFIAKGYDANLDRKSTRLNSSHVKISYAVFCLKKNRVSLGISIILS